jgi:erythromycin esterase-like protein
MIGEARIVSLGEATHGSREFFQLKHRMLEFLASEMGFSIFSIEANLPETYRMNDYVLEGKGDPAQLLRSVGKIRRSSPLRQRHSVGIMSTSPYVCQVEM